MNLLGCPPSQLSLLLLFMPHILNLPKCPSLIFCISEQYDTKLIFRTQRSRLDKTKCSQADDVFDRCHLVRISQSHSYTRSTQSDGGMVQRRSLGQSLAGEGMTMHVIWHNAAYNPASRDRMPARSEKLTVKIRSYLVAPVAQALLRCPTVLAHDSRAGL
jgi:hypothetical protein